MREGLKGTFYLAKTPNEWTGHFSQNGSQTPMVFQTFKVSKHGIKGKGVDSLGEFVISGEVLNKTIAKFVKQYIGKHAVQYEGEIKNKKKEIEGKWSMPEHGLSDSFKIIKTKKK